MARFKPPEILKTQHGELRRTGFEIEYAGVDIDKSVTALQDLVGGDIEQVNAFHYKITNTGRGDFSVEIDAALLKEDKYRNYLEAVGVDIDSLSYEKEIDEFLKDVASFVVPCEIVTPPLLMNNMEIVEAIVKSLRQKKAKGTTASVFYAFGLHMNPELASTDVTYLLAHIRAFALLYDWICDRSKVDMTRKLTPYIDPYPGEYIELIMSNDYQPSILGLLDDYLTLVNTRNQALDMLPAFAVIDETSVISRASEPDLIKPRPAFHYRLANSLIDEPGWTVADEWQYWLAVEKLANDKQLLEKVRRSYLDYRSTFLQLSNKGWIEKVSGLLYH